MILNEKCKNSSLKSNKNCRKIVWNSFKKVKSSKKIRKSKLLLKSMNFQVNLSHLDKNKNKISLLTSKSKAKMKFQPKSPIKECNRAIR